METCQVEEQLKEVQSQKSFIDWVSEAFIYKRKRKLQKFKRDLEKENPEEEGDSNTFIT